MTLASLGAAVLRRIDPETAHGFAIKALRHDLVPAPLPVTDPRLAVGLGDLRLPNPLGLAAGFDKNAEVPDAILRLGFGFTEVGTLTPRAQPGNPRPRIFRLPEIGGVINRLGFNNEGHDAARRRLSARSDRSGIVGVNVGANKDSADRTADYVAGIAAFAPLAAYFTINVSSPNTPGLRDLQARDALDDLLARSLAARDAAVPGANRRIPVLLKIAPDVTEESLDDIAEIALARGVDGLIVSNTTVSRAGIAHRLAGEAGGLSGRPLMERSTIVLAKVRRRIGHRLFLIGVGGVAGPEDALAKLSAGADAIQVYTGFVYAGPGLVPTILGGLVSEMDRLGLTSVSQLTATAVDRWADRPIPA